MFWLNASLAETGENVNHLTDYVWLVVQCVGSCAWVINNSLRVELLWHLSEKCLLRAAGVGARALSPHGEGLEWRTNYVAVAGGQGGGGRSTGVDTHWKRKKRTWEEEEEVEGEEWAIYPDDNEPKFGARGDEHQ